MRQGFGNLRKDGAQHGYDMTRITTIQARAMGILPMKQRKPKLKTSVQWDARIIPGGVWLQFPEIPPSLNVWSKWFWAKQNKYKHTLYNAVSALRIARKLPKAKLATVIITYYFGTRRRRDIVDNFSPKFLMDSLVNGGFLEDDRSDWVQVELVAEYDRDRPHCEIVIRKVY